MRTVAFVTQKGGAGKSTLAACLADAAEEAGERVFMIDLDPQGSLTSWCTTRQAETPGVDTTSPAQLDTALGALAHNGYTLAVIDTAGTDSPATTAAMRAADLCLIPSRPSAFDVRATERTRDALKTLQREFAFVLNQCPPGPHNSRAADGARALGLMGVLILPMVTSRVDYQSAALAGLGVTEFNPAGKAAAEIRELWASIRKRLGGTKHAQSTPPQTAANA